MTILNEIENDSVIKIKGIKSLVRVVLYSDKNLSIDWHGEFQEKEDILADKYNYYLPGIVVGSFKKSGDLLSIYRRNINLNFIKEKSISISIKTTIKPLNSMV